MSIVSDKRMDIIKAAIKIFSKKGYYKATIEDIANEASVGKGTVYLYFSGKEQLFEEMLKHILCEYCKDVIYILSRDESINLKITKLVEFYRQNIKGQMDLIQKIIGEYDPMSSDEVKVMFKQKRKELKKAMYKFMEDGIETGEVRTNIDKSITSTSIFSTIEHYFIDKIHGEDIEIDEISTDDLIKFIVSMLK